MTSASADRHIGQYKIVRTLGAGGMGTVFLGEHLLLGRVAAIKTLLPSLSSQRDIVDRFFTEARAISAISDPGVVSIYDFGYHVDGTAYIVMELLEGESLSARLERLGKLRLVDALRLARQLSSSLAAAHARDIVHRDLKPGNVFLVRDAEVQGGERTKLLDFGICKLDDPEAPTTTQTGAMLGTPVYMSPEQCRGAGGVDHRSDIYSLGCVLFHMIVGRPPFDCEGTGDYIAAHLKEPAPVPSSLAPELPPAIDALIARCLAKDPDQRLQSMTELQDELERVLASLSDGGVGVPAVPKQMTPLGEGFQSAYDVNARSRLRVFGDTPSSRRWFVDSQLPVSSSGPYDVERPRTGWGKRLAFLAALCIGVAAGLVGTNYVLEAEAARAVPITPPPAPDLAIVEPTTTSVQLTARDDAPPAAADDEGEGERAARSTKQLQASRKPPRPHASKPRPRPRPPVRTVPPPDTEDLYDTR